MVGVLIRMKLVLLRNSMTGERATWMIFLWTWRIDCRRHHACSEPLLSAHLSVAVDILALVYAMWLLGWILGRIPVGGQSALRADYFRFLPIPRLRLATGLLGTASSQHWNGGHAASLCQLGDLRRPTWCGSNPHCHPGHGLTTPVCSALLTCRNQHLQCGRAIQSRWRNCRTPAGYHALCSPGPVGHHCWDHPIRYLANRTSSSAFFDYPASPFKLGPGRCRGCLPIQLAGSSGRADGPGGNNSPLVCRLEPTAFPAREQPATIVRGSSGNTARSHHTWRWRAFSGATMGAINKEVRTWWRDPSHMVKIFLPIGWALLWCLSPLTFGSTLALPFTAPALALMAMTSSANLYGEEGRRSGSRC